MASGPEYNKELARLQRLCVRRECCRRELESKALKALDGDASLAGELVASLVADGFCDDLRYAGAYVREKSSLSGWGPVKIRAMLLSKGISPDVVSEALEEMDTERACQKLERLIQARGRSLGGDPAARPKLLRYALSRGFSYEQAVAATDKYLNTI